MKATVLDIETIPNMEMIGFLPEPKVDSRIKDPAKIEKSIEDSRTKQIEVMGLSPLTGRVCVAVFKSQDHETKDYLSAVSDDHERAIVGECLSMLDVLYSTSDHTLVTYNGGSFDLPFLFTRAAILGCKPPQYALDLWTKRYKTVPHCDLMQVLSGWDRSKVISLANACRLMLQEEKPEMGYEKYLAMIERGEGVKIADECADHAELTLKLFRKIEPFFISGSIIPSFEHSIKKD